VATTGAGASEKQTEGKGRLFVWNAISRIRGPGERPLNNVSPKASYSRGFFCLSQAACMRGVIRALYYRIYLYNMNLEMG
jgi:hypothetical protein